MTSYELVKAAIHFRQPERLPVFQAPLGVSDSAWVPLDQAACFTPVALRADEWGCIWGNTSTVKNMGQVTGHPFANGIPSDLEKTAFPDYTLDARYAGVEPFLRKAEADEKYVIGGLFMVLFERVHSLMGFENALVGIIDPELQPDVVRLMEHIVNVQLTYVENLNRRFGSRIHAISMTDDFGTQQAAYVSADFWMQFFFPFYKKLFGRMHAAGYDVWVHSCGKVNEIIECYIQAGANVMNLQQPRALGIEEIGRRYGGRVAFEAVCDIQVTLPGGDRNRIADDARLLMEHWGRADGGIMLSDYGDADAIGTSLESKRIMYEEFSRLSESVYGKPLPELP